MKTHLLRAILRVCAAASLLLCSCIDSREEVWIEANGSGRAEIRITLPAAALAAKGGEKGVGEWIDGYLKGNPSLTRSRYQIHTEGDRAEISIEAAFDSAMDLVDLTESGAASTLPPAAEQLAGKVKVEVHGRTLDYERISSPGKALPGSGFLPASTLQGRSLTTIVHLPAEAFDHNATRVENGGRTLIWETPLAHAVRKPLVHRFRMKIPLPWPWIAGIGIPVSIAGCWILRRIFYRKKPVHPIPGGLLDKRGS